MLLDREAQQMSPPSSNALPCRARAQYASDIVLGVSLLGDTAAIFFALALASCLRIPAPETLFSFSPPAWTPTAPVLFLETLGLLVLLGSQHVYERHLHLVHHESIWESATKSLGLWAGGLLLLSSLFPTGPTLTPAHLFKAAPLAAVALTLWRLLLHQLIAHPAIAQYLLRRVLVLGWSMEIAEIFELLGRDSTHPYTPAGYLAFHPTPAPATQIPPLPPPGSLPKLGELSTLPEKDEPLLRHLLRLHHIDHVLLAHQEVPGSYIARLSRVCENELADFAVIPAYFTLFRSGIEVRTVNGIPLIAISRLPLDFPHNRALKRAFDILGALVGLSLSLPLLLFLGFLIHRESPGPILYRQRRLGLKGRIFEMLKLRSMHLNAEPQNIAQWSTKEDARRLKIGALMRRFNLDEIPQFWNVLKGEMSLVGPRPERPEFTSVFQESIEDYNVRHGVKPGMTGLAQIRGLRGDTPLADRIRADLSYIEHWSLWMDFKIMLLTFVSNKNAH
jgi:exopolysaccharide biosynthesis polyprenyl glycosylphosphotransferase